MGFDSKNGTSQSHSKLVDTPVDCGVIEEKPDTLNTHQQLGVPSHHVTLQDLGVKLQDAFKEWKHMCSYTRKNPDDVGLKESLCSLYKILKDTFDAQPFLDNEHKELKCEFEENVKDIINRHHTTIELVQQKIAQFGMMCSDLKLEDFNLVKIRNIFIFYRETANFITSLKLAQGCFHLPETLAGTYSKMITLLSKHHEDYKKALWTKFTQEAQKQETKKTRTTSELKFKEQYAVFEIYTVLKKTLYVEHELIQPWDFSSYNKHDHDAYKAWQNRTMSFESLKALLSLLNTDNTYQKLSGLSDYKELQDSMEILIRIKKIIQHRLRSNLSCTDQTGHNYRTQFNRIENYLVQLHNQAGASLETSYYSMHSSMKNKLVILEESEKTKENPDRVRREAILFNLDTIFRNTINGLHEVSQRHHSVVLSECDDNPSGRTCIPG